MRIGCPKKRFNPIKKVLECRLSCGALSKYEVLFGQVDRFYERGTFFFFRTPDTEKNVFFFLASSKFCKQFYI